jgi:hypothetical protein
MKFISLAILCICSYGALAQNPFIDTTMPATPNVPAPSAVSAGYAPAAAAATIAMDTQQGALSVFIPQTEIKGVQKDWGRYVGQGSKGKTAIADGQYTQYSAVNKNISAEPFNISARFAGTTEGVKLSVWLSDNNNFENTGSTTGDRALALQKYIHDFAIMEYRQAVLYELNANKAKQSDLENDLTKLMKQENILTLRIEENNRAIIKSNDAIATHRNDVESLTVRIEAQKGMVQNTAADPNATEGARKTLGQLESEKRELQKKNDREGKNIVQFKAQIMADERAKADIKEREISKAENIDKQKQVVTQIKAKLDAIN